MTEQPAQFTAALLATALGRKRASVYRDLRGCAPTGKVLVNGRETDAWTLDALPEKLRRLLWESVEKRGYRSPETLIQHNDKRWEPAIPLAKLRAAHVEKAQKTREAFAEVLNRLDKAPWWELRSIGLKAYQRVFGSPITSRHWERILERILERDGGRYEFERLELFLDDNLTAETGSRAPAPFDASLLRPALDLVKDPSRPEPRESAHVMAKSFEAYEHLIAQGLKPAKAKRQVVDFLDSQEVSLAKNRKTLDAQFRYKYRAWTEGGCKVVAILDRRKGNSGRKGAPTLDDEAVDKLVARALNCGGRLQQAWRELWQEDALPSACYEFYADTNGDRVPEPIRRRAMPEVKRLASHHIGPKEAKLKGPKLVRTWDGLPSGFEAQSDDCTAPVYFWEHDDTAKAGVRITRGQFLPWIDTRSTYIYHFQLIPEKGYSSIDILRGIIRLHDVWGLPEQFYFEQGLWKKSLLLKGRDRRTLGDAVIGLEQMGVKFRHAHDPSAKIVERQLGALQNMMEHERGYAGRDERKDCPEHIRRWIREVESGKRHPSECFYSYEEWLGRLKDICDRYNDTPSHGKLCRGLSPRDCWRENLDPNNPPILLSHEARHVLATHRREATVTEQGVRISIGKQSFLYRNEASGARVGEKVMVWWDPEFMEDHVFISDLDGSRMELISAATPVPAIGASSEQLATAMGQAKAHARYARVKYTELKKLYPEEFAHRETRTVYVDPQTREQGEAIAQQRNERQRQQKRIKSAERRTGLSVPLRPGRERQQTEGMAELARLGIKAENLD